MFQSCKAKKIKITTDYTGETGSNFNDAFYDCSSLTEVNLNGIRIGRAGSMFSNCSNLTSVELNTDYTTMMSGAFYYCGKLKTIKLSSLKSIASDSSDTSLTYTFTNCSALENLTINDTDTTVASINLSSSPKLTVESMLSVFNSLKPRDAAPSSSDSYSGVVKLGSTNLAKLTDEQKAIALNKNWMLV